MLYNSKNATDTNNVQVELSLNPKCAYKVRLERSLTHSLGAIIGKYIINVFSLIAVCLLLTLSYQLRKLEENATCPLLQIALPLAAKPYIIIQASAIISAILQHLANYFSFIPPIDTKGQSGFMELLIIPVILYMTAFALTYLIATGFLIGVIFQGQAFNTILLKFINRFCFGLSWLPDYVLSGANKVPIIVVAFMLSVAHSACGGLALSIGFCFYFFKMVSLYEDFWEEIVYWPLRVFKIKLKEFKEKKKMDLPKFHLPPINDISFHLTLMLLWAIVVSINIPTVLVWAKQYRYNTKLHPDPGFLVTVLMSLCVGILWQSDTPKPGLIFSKQLSYVIFCLSVFIMIYGQTSLYRISYAICIVYVLVTLHQLVAPWFTPEEEIPDLSLENYKMEPIPDLLPIIDPLDEFELSKDATELIPEKVEAEGKEFDVTEKETVEEKLDEETKSDVNVKTENENVEHIEEDNEQDNDDDDAEQIIEKKKGEETPSSDTSSSSFEQISEKDITYC